MQDAPSFHKNKQPMLEILQKTLPPIPHNVLEIASGSGQHGPFFAAHFSQMTWWPTDISPESIASINAWREHSDQKAVKAAQILDVASNAWRQGNPIGDGPEQFTAIVSMNMIHIAPIKAAYGLLEGAAKHLASKGQVIFYGPFKQGGKHTAPTNQAFDESLRARNSDWGIRDLEHIIETAQSSGLSHIETFKMPANNLSIVFEKQNH